MRYTINGPLATEIELIAVKDEERSQKLCKLDADDSGNIHLPENRRSFLQLPADIRTLIYAHFFDGIVVLLQTNENAAFWDSHIEGKINVKQPFPVPCARRNKFNPFALVSTCLCVAREARWMFFNTATFVAVGPEPFLNMFYELKLYGTPQILPDDSSLGFDPFAIMQNFWLDITIQPDTRSGEQRVYTQEKLKSALMVLHCRMALKKLYITFDLSSKLGWHPDKDYIPHVDILRNILSFTPWTRFNISYSNTHAYVPHRWYLGCVEATGALNKILRYNIERTQSSAGNSDGRMSQSDESDCEDAHNTEFDGMKLDNEKA